MRFGREHHLPIRPMPYTRAHATHLQADGARDKRIVGVGQVQIRQPVPLAFNQLQFGLGFRIC